MLYIQTLHIEKMENFNEIINGDKPVLVDFFANWCGHCTAMAPIVEALGKDLQGIARILKIDVDKNEALSTQYKIQTIPTFILFKKGEVMWRHSGGMNKASLEAEIKKHVK